MSKGFTLIEVLVVVLIIGILTSVALPQYRKAVVKTKVMKLLPLIRTIDSAEQVYYATYQKYTKIFSDLDIDLPAGGTVNADGTRITYGDFACFTGAADENPISHSVYCNSTDPSAPAIEKYLIRDYFICWHYSNSTKERICAGLPDAIPSSSGNSYHF